MILLRIGLNLSIKLMLLVIMHDLDYRKLEITYLLNMNLTENYWLL